MRSCVLLGLNKTASHMTADSTQSAKYFYFPWSDNYRGTFSTAESYVEEGNSPLYPSRVGAFEQRRPAASVQPLKGDNLNMPFAPFEQWPCGAQESDWLRRYKEAKYIDRPDGHGNGTFSLAPRCQEGQLWSGVAHTCVPFDDPIPVWSPIYQSIFPQMSFYVEPNFPLVDKIAPPTTW